ncbi:MAG: DUF1003 domain-containing protein [Patescibacteria group bacterium]
MAKKKKKVTLTQSLDIKDFSADLKKLTRRQRMIRSFKARMEKDRPPLDRLADQLNSWFGTNIFLLMNLIWFVIWITLNTGLVDGVAPFDPFPFSFLTMTVSLEAIFLSIFVLISQKRASRIDDLREEIHLQINTIAEEEITKMLKMQALLLQKMGIDVSKDPELVNMLMPTDQRKIEEKIEEQLQ